MAPFVSDSCHASIGGPGRAGHIRGLVRGKENHDRSNLFRLPGAPQGNGTQQTIKLLVVLHEIFRHGCIRETRDNSVDPDAVAGIIVRHHPCQAINTCLACTVCLVTRSAAEKACGRGSTDHAPAARGKQRPNTMLAGKENTCEVNSDRAVPYFLCEFVGASILANKFNPRVCYYDIQPTPARNSLVDCPCHLVLAGDISNQWKSFTA